MPHPLIPRDARFGAGPTYAALRVLARQCTARFRTPGRRVATLAAAVALACFGTVAAAPAPAQSEKPNRRTPVVEVYESCRDTVVNISTTRVVRVRNWRYNSPFDELFNLGPRYLDQQVSSVGSGVVIHETGYVVTNAHVVLQASDVRVTFANGKTLPATVVALDREHDLAVLAVDAGGDLPAVALGKPNDILIGETVIAIGNPLGLQHSVSAGIVSALNRDVRVDRGVSFEGLIQTDAPINPGNSGGPLLNVHGELVGINTAVRADAQSIGFAIPVARLWELLPDMLDIERRQRVSFGIAVDTAKAEVVKVAPNSPAARAGVKPGDRVARFNGRPIRNGIDYYVDLLRQKPGRAVKLALQRGDQQVDASVELEQLPPPDGRKLGASMLGVTLGPIPASLRRELDLPAYVGLIVEAVEPRSPAADAGIEPRDLIVGLSRIGVSTLEDVGGVLENFPAGDRIVVEGWRLHSDPPFRWDAAVRTRAAR